MDHHHEQGDDEQHYCDFVIRNYKHLHPHLLDFKNWQIHHSLVDALNLDNLKEGGGGEGGGSGGGGGGFDTGTGTSIPNVRKIAPDLFTFQMLSEKTCQEIIEEVEHFENWCAEINFSPRRPNTMNNYGAILDDFGFEKCLDEIVNKVVNPLSALLFPHIDPCDSHHGFLVEYKIGKDVKLDFHVDDSEVTLNVCLGKQFTNGSLYFGGVRCPLHQQTQPQPSENVYVTHQPGVALLHLGKHRHSALKITSGQRLNLILWCRSSAFREKYRSLSLLQQQQQQEQPYYCPEWCNYGKRSVI